MANNCFFSQLLIDHVRSNLRTKLAEWGGEASQVHVVLAPIKWYREPGTLPGLQEIVKPLESQKLVFVILRHTTPAPACRDSGLVQILDATKVIHF